MLGCPLNQNGEPWLSLKPEYGFAGSGPSSGGRLSPFFRNVTVCTTRLLKTHLTESPAWIVIVLRKKAFMSSAAGNFRFPDWLAFGGGPPATTTFVFALAPDAAVPAATVAITSVAMHRLNDMDPPPSRLVARR